MAILRRKKNDYSENNNIFWTTLSDLMLGLAIIFIAMFVLAMTGFTQNTFLQQKDKMEAAEKIEQEFQEQKINVQIDKVTGSISIPATSLFELNSYVLTPQGKDLLNKLAPVYINTIFGNQKLEKDVEHISFRGYTDSQLYSGVKTNEEQFLRNMDLSLKRANAVAEYILLHTNYDKKYSLSLRKKIVVEGNSSNNPIMTDGKEDYAKSRRVELKLIVKDTDISTVLGLKK